MNNLSLGRYKTVETLVGAVINGLFSLFFVVLMFGGLAEIPMQVSNGLFIDSIPQGFAIGFMGTFFTSFLTRKRNRNAQLMVNQKTMQASWLPAHPAVRAILFAVVGAVLSLIFFCLLTLGLRIDAMALSYASVAKTVWGVCLGGIVAVTAIRFALNDYAS